MVFQTLMGELMNNDIREIASQSGAHACGIAHIGGFAAAPKGFRSGDILSDATKDPAPHLIFSVTDMTATGAAIKKAGGSMQGEPRPFGNSGIVIGIAIDPAGNLLELIQRRQLEAEAG
jgi:predicted enzyme related to lactoylglutathione lyase